MSVIDWPGFNIDLTPPPCLRPLLELRRDAQLARLPMDNLKVRITPSIADELREYAERISRLGPSKFTVGMGDHIFGMVIVAVDADALELVK